MICMPHIQLNNFFLTLVVSYFMSPVHVYISTHINEKDIMFYFSKFHGIKKGSTLTLVAPSLLSLPSLFIVRVDQSLLV